MTRIAADEVADRSEFPDLEWVEVNDATGNVIGNVQC